MTVQEFRDLTESQQTEVLYGDAVYIDKRKSGDNSIVIYQIDGFYVEVCFYKYRQHIAWVRCSDSINILNPYLDKMDIVELMVSRDN
jgi:hypothetical protein